MLMGLQEADHLAEGSLLGAGEVLNRHAHNRSLSRKCMANNVGEVQRHSHKEGEDTMHADGGEDKCRRRPLDLVPLYLHNTSRMFAARPFVFLMDLLCLYTVGVAVIAFAVEGDRFECKHLEVLE